MREIHYIVVLVLSIGFRVEGPYDICVGQLDGHPFWVDHRPIIDFGNDTDKEKNQKDFDIRCWYRYR